jgi:hypothetical protein
MNRSFSALIFPGDALPFGVNRLFLNALVSRQVARSNET